MEIWKEIVREYEVSSHGRVRSWRSPSGCGAPRKKPLMRKLQDLNGYNAVMIDGRLRKVCRLVAEAFFGASDLQVNHKNGEKRDDCVENLEYCTGSENIQHAYDNGLIPKGIEHHKAKLSDEQIKNILADNRPQRIIAASYGIAQLHVSRLKRGLCRKDATRGVYVAPLVDHRSDPDWRLRQSERVASSLKGKGVSKIPSGYRAFLRRKHLGVFRSEIEALVAVENARSVYRKVLAP